MRGLGVRLAQLDGGEEVPFGVEALEEAGGAVDHVEAAVGAGLDIDGNGELPGKAAQPTERGPSGGIDIRASGLDGLDAEGAGGAVEADGEVGESIDGARLLGRLVVAPVGEGIPGPASAKDAAANLAPGLPLEGAGGEGGLVVLGEPPAVGVAGRGGETGGAAIGNVAGDDRGVGGIDEDDVELARREAILHVAVRHVAVVAQVPDPGPGEGGAGIDGDAQVDAPAGGIGEGVDFIGHAGDLGGALGVDEHVFGHVAALEGDPDHRAHREEGQRRDHGKQGEEGEGSPAQAGGEGGSYGDGRRERGQAQDPAHPGPRSPVEGEGREREARHREDEGDSEGGAGVEPREPAVRPGAVDRPGGEQDGGDGEVGVEPRHLLAGEGERREENQEPEHEEAREG